LSQRKETTVSHERAKRIPWIVAILLAVRIALAACAPGGASGSNGDQEDGRPSANQPAAANTGSGDDDAQDDRDDDPWDTDGQDDSEARDNRDDNQVKGTRRCERSPR
jgi:hypothetical protein